MISDHLYLILDLCTLAFPLAQSFDSKLKFYQKWYALFPAIAIVGFFFIAWDVVFTSKGIWGFNESYLVGVEIIQLPIEEWLFFLVVPFACIFIYEATLYYLKSRPMLQVVRKLSVSIAIILLIVGFLNTQKSYTGLTFILAGTAIVLHLIVIKRDYLDRFWIAYVFSLIPFLLVNGILTGSFIANEIVWYDNMENLGIRIGTIPIEDAVYLLLYLLGIVTIYEAILKRFPMRYQLQ